MSDYTLLAAVLSLRALSAPLPAHRPSCRPTSPPPARPPLRRRAASFPLLVTPSDVTSHRPAACAVHRARRSRPRPHPRPACTRAGPTVLALAPPTPGRAALACRAALLRPAWAPALVRLRSRFCRCYPRLHPAGAPVDIRPGAFSPVPFHGAFAHGVPSAGNTVCPVGTMWGPLA